MSARPARQPMVERYTAELEDLVREARELAGALGPGQFNWRPAPDRWSVGQNLDHVLRTGRPYLEAIRSTVPDALARVDAARRPYPPGWVGTLLVRTMEPPPGRRVRTFRRLWPASQHDREPLLDAFDAFHLEVAAEAVRTGDAAWHAARLRSPFLPVIRLTLGQAFAVLAAHGRRHMWQAREVLRAPGFPDSAG